MVVEKKHVDIDEAIPKIRKAINEFYQYRIKESNAAVGKGEARVKQKRNAPE